MNILAALVLGVLIGWIIEWIIDWVYWRNRTRQLAQEVDSLQHTNDSINAKLKALEDSKKNKRSQLSKTRPFGKTGKDNLKAIRGVGPVIEKRLNQAGIYTFEEMSRLTPDELQEILGELIRKFFPGEDKMIAQAKEFAEQKPPAG